MFKKILVPLDGSQFSSKALPYAIEMARRFESAIFLLHVVKPAPIAVMPPAVDTGISPVAVQIAATSAQEQDQKNKAWAERYLKTKARQIKARGIKASATVLSGEVARTILKFCEEKGIDLVVMTTSGKGGIKRAFMGSTTDIVMRAPGFPVLAIRPRNQ